MKGKPCRFLLLASSLILLSVHLGVAQAQLVNLSTRGPVGTGDSVMIGGFIIGGSSPKTVLIRAIGPTLANAGVPDLLYDPTLTLHSGQKVLATNNNWQDSQAEAIRATGKAPSDHRESAILITLNPGPYTAIVRGVSDTVGNALVEIYEVNTLPASLTSGLWSGSIIQFYVSSDGTQLTSPFKVFQHIVK